MLGLIRTIFVLCAIAQVSVLGSAAWAQVESRLFGDVPSILPKAGPPAVDRVSLSPSGGKVAFVFVQGKDVVLSVNDLTTRQALAAARFEGAEPLWTVWGGENHVLFAYNRNNVTTAERVRFNVNSDRRFMQFVFVAVMDVRDGSVRYVNQFRTDLPMDQINNTNRDFRDIRKIGNIRPDKEKIDFFFNYGEMSYYIEQNISTGEIVERDYKGKYQQFYDNWVHDSTGAPAMYVTGSGDVRVDCLPEENREPEFRGARVENGWELWPVGPGPQPGTGAFIVVSEATGQPDTLQLFACEDVSRADYLSIPGQVVQGAFFDPYRQAYFGIWANAPDDAGDISFSFIPEVAGIIDMLSAEFGADELIWPIDFAANGASLLFYTGKEEAFYLYRAETSELLKLVTLAALTTAD